MTRADRAVRRASSQLADGESLVASAAGIEADGRRRAAVLVTDRRVLVVWLRGAAPEELSLEDATARRSDPGDLLTVAGPGLEVALRAVERSAADQVVAVLEEHRPRAEAPYAEKVPHVRILDTPADPAMLEDDRFVPLEELAGN